MGYPCIEKPHRFVHVCVCLFSPLEHASSMVKYLISGRFLSSVPGPKVLGITATFLTSFISSMYNWYILKIRKFPEGRSRTPGSFLAKVVPGGGRSFPVEEGRSWSRSTPEVVPGQGHLLPGVFPLPSHLFPVIAVTHFKHLGVLGKQITNGFSIYNKTSYAMLGNLLLLILDLSMLINID